MYRLIYKSRSVEQITWDDVTDILHASEKYNVAHDINGVLLATETHFLQVIEGRFEDVNEAFMRIARDSRHEDIRLISYSVIDARLFSGWGMRGIGMFGFNDDLEQKLKKKYGEEDGCVKFPLEEWMVLAMVWDIKMVQDLPSWKK
jgi:hypothetical protein